MPRRVHEHGALTRSRFRAFLGQLLAGLILLSGWWGMAGSAAAASYPPALGCAVSGLVPAGSGLLQVRGTGFGAGARVAISVAGRDAGTVGADAAGSFQVSVLTGLTDALAAGAEVTASDAGCATTGALAIENATGNSGDSVSPPATSDHGSAAGKPGPANRHRAHPAPSPASPEPMPPARPAGPPAAAIPAIPAIALTGLPPQLFLGVAGAVLLAGTALIGLTGRLGHRSERPARPSVASAPPTPGAA